MDSGDEGAGVLDWWVVGCLGLEASLCHTSKCSGKADYANQII